MLGAANVYINKTRGLQPLTEVLSKMQQNSEVDVNVLVNLYHTKLAAALNQNVLLEAKPETLKNDLKKKERTFRAAANPRM